MTRVWEPLVIGLVFGIVGGLVFVVNDYAAVHAAALDWIGFVVLGAGGWLWTVGTIALGVQLGQRDR